MSVHPGNIVDIRSWRILFKLYVCLGKIHKKTESVLAGFTDKKEGTVEIAQNVIPKVNINVNNQKSWQYSH